METAEQIVYNLVKEKKILPQEAAVLLEELEAGPVEEDIAIIGMSLRLPGAGSVDEYWENLMAHKNCIGKFPDSRRKDACALDSSLTPDQKEDPFLEGGYLAEIDKFDAEFFRLSPQGAKLIDPCHRLFLVTAWEAFQDGGYTREAIDGEPVGVYVGIDQTYKSEYMKLALNTNMDFAARTASWSSILAGRVAHAFNLSGPTIVIDTACSAGLVSVHMAANAMNRGECSMAIAGGVNILYTPNRKNSLGNVQSRGTVLRAFDQESNGTIWGEGVCALLLKPIKQAMADGDNIHGVVKGSAINNDGATGAITTPSAEAQSDVIERAWKFAGISPETISYVEAHGTGTKLGDPIEVKGLAAAIRKHSSKKQFCGIGSVKTNIGHSVAASGIASMIKVVCAMKHATLPATINFKQPNTYINFADSPLYVVGKTLPWETGENVRRAGVSSFGFSGTNCHVVLEDSPLSPLSADNRSGIRQVFVLSAKSASVLRDYLTRYMDYLRKHPGLSFPDICYTSFSGRSHYDCRLAVVAASLADLIEKLSLLAGTEDWDDISGDIFSGSGLRGDSMQLDEALREQTEDFSFDIPGGGDREDTLQEICRLYVKGADTNWKKLFSSPQKRIISLPGYPLKQTRCWIEAASPEPAELASAQLTEGRLIHPLLGHLVVDTPLNTVYACRFHPQRQWVLTDHKIMQRNVLPGTSYIEIARAACALYFDAEVLELQDITFFRPVLLEAEEERTIQTIITKYDGERIDFLMCSQQNDEWIRHAAGSAVLTRDRERVVDIQRIITGCPQLTAGEDIASATSVAEFGPRWDSISEVNAGPGELLVGLKIPDDLKEDLEDHRFHAGMLDNALNILIRMNDNQHYYLPFTFKRFRIFKPMPVRFFSHLKNNPDLSQGKEILSFNIDLIDEEGAVFAEIEDYAIKKVPKQDFQYKPAGMFYRIGWRVQELREAGAHQRQGMTLVFMDSRGLGKELVRGLRQEKCDVIEVFPGDSFSKLSETAFQVGNNEEDYRTLFSSLQGRNLDRILHLFTLAEGNENLHREEWEERQQRGVFSVFRMIKGLVAENYNHPLKVYLVSEYANPVTKNQEFIFPHNMPLFGIGKALAHEHVNITCRCLDLDRETQADRILAELGGEEEDYLIAYRGGLRYKEELQRYNIDFAEQNPFAVKAEGLYLITGGLGGIGLETAKYLASRNPVHLALTGRGEFPPRESWEEILSSGSDQKLCRKIRALEELEATGLSVDYYAADVADEEAMGRVLAELRVRYGKIDGIFHCAGVPGDGFLIRKSEEDLAQVLRPKIEGTRNLDRLCTEDNPDIFVLYSSIFTFMGGPGQGDYCAANAFLDSFAFQRNRSRGRTLTINWPGWKEAGMALEMGAEKTSGVFQSLTTSEALRLFEEVLNKDLDRVVIGDFDFQALGYILDSYHLNFSGELQLHINRNLRKNRNDLPETTGKAIILTGKDETDFTETEKIVAGIWASVLGLEEINVYQTFQDLGGDSIMATYILKEMENHFPGNINISDIFTYPSIDLLAAHLDRKQGKEMTLPADGEEDDLDKILDQVSKGEISFDNAADLLQQDE